MKKIFLSSMLTLGMLLTFAIPLSAAPSIQLVINSEVVHSDAPPVSVAGRTMVSLASLKPLKLNLVWNASQKTVTVNAPGVKEKLVLTIGQKEASYGEKMLTLDVPAQLSNNRVVVPLRFISEAFKAEVKWKADKNTVIIRSADQVEKYKKFYQSTDLVAARKIAVNLPSKDENTLNNTEEGVYYQYIFPEGEVLRYYSVVGNLLTYYEIKDDVKHLVWEGVEGDSEKYTKEKGKRPPVDKTQYYFLQERVDHSVTYGKVGGGKPVTQALPKNSTGLSAIIVPISGEVRKDQMK
ncbi:copper amine oxidase N-terminal domain-containing protein [Paenibacillus sp. SEL1]|uniref:copper amine oxidase N-terminal domain-containing protein n=1 Tax=Paenibacillus TaxID=44249 RepID=UPI0020B89763|nr:MULTISPECIES: copper amine oxidase N-terminal domain-containing protein [Paenibacillus]MCP3809537.1 copper amine oxidase N-terminal domain-containing protein [Paenibacillus sp. Lou8.1]MDY7990045.1 copper amine oxidase N-terminal domain-containing protein [Paenibacillus polymyxa]MDY8116592.1 copper amine oxidase N-terminal domain-containing protein [Paenibacillus polymyxa]